MITHTVLTVHNHLKRKFTTFWKHRHVGRKVCMTLLATGILLAASEFMLQLHKWGLQNLS